MVIGEWLPVHGGLPRFNRDLASALAGLSHHVTSIAVDPRPDDRTDARARGVRLVVPDGPDLRVRPSQVPEGVDVVVGHARAAFAPAVAQARRDFPDAALAMVVHTVPEELAPFREGKDPADARREAGVRTGQIVRMCQGAEVVYGVGPHLSQYWQERLGRPVHQVVPGLDTTGGEPVAGPPDGERRVLLLGRMEDQQIKGVDIAASAFAHLPEQTRGGTRFVVMGTPEGTEAQLARHLHQQYAVPADQIQVEPYSPDPKKVVHQLRKASVVVMPSRAEGYGLVAHEAVSLGVPVLVSDRSGFGQLLVRDTPGGSSLVVPVTGDLGRDRDRWAEALAGALDDPAAHFDQARAARGRLATWPQVAHDWTDSIHQARAGRTTTSPPGPGHPTDLGPAPAPGAAPPQPLPPTPQHLGGLPVGAGHGPGQPLPAADLPVGMQHLADHSAVRTGHSRPGQPPPSADLPVGMQHLGGPEAQERGRAAFQPGTPGPAPPVGPTPSARPPGAKKDPGVGW